MLTGIAIIIGGFNFVGLGMIYTGANYDSNPTWGFFQSLFYFEFVAIAFVVCGYILLQILFYTSPEKVEPKPIATNVIRPRQELVDENPPEIKQKSILVQPPIIMPKPEPPPKPVPTAAEMKRKALEQITGRDFK